MQNAYLLSQQYERHQQDGGKLEYEVNIRSCDLFFELFYADEFIFLKKLGCVSKCWVRKGVWKGENGKDSYLKNLKIEEI